MTSDVMTGSVREWLAEEIDSQASFRERVAENYPDDRRNDRAAEGLRWLANEVRTTEGYDDTLRRLNALATKHGVGAEMLWPSSENFNGSQFRFHYAGETAEEYLDRLADAAEIGWETGE